MFPAGPGALLVRVEAVLVAAAASVPEACAALLVGVVVPLEHKLGARALLPGKPADADGRGDGCGGRGRKEGRRINREKKISAILG